MALELVAQPISSKAMPATLAIIVHFHQVRTERAAAAARLWSSRRTYPAFGDAVAEFTTGIAQNSSPVDPLHALKKERTSGAGAIWEGLMLGKTVRVPRHVELSEPGSRRTKPSLTSSYFAKSL